jgi:predicted Co/Zn/Cd cation transporter (cation efflux family)
VFRTRIVRDSLFRDVHFKCPDEDDVEGYTDFSEIWGALQDSMRQKGDKQMLGATVKSIVGQATWCTGFVHP